MIVSRLSRAESFGVFSRQTRTVKLPSPYHHTIHCRSLPAHTLFLCLRTSCCVWGLVSVSVSGGLFVAMEKRGDSYCRVSSLDGLWL